ncbi:MAG: hypothetical protein QXD55_01465 [Candidatus Aenigmatarchaeota archaeon]
MKKSPLFAAVLNFIIWGSGYFYLNKSIIKGFIFFILYSLIGLFLILLILSVSYPLIFSIIFWVFFWCLWCSIFLAYDAYKISKEVNIKPLKIKKVKPFVRRPKIQTKRR